MTDDVKQQQWEPVRTIGESHRTSDGYFTRVTVVRGLRGGLRRRLSILRDFPDGRKGIHIAHVDLTTELLDETIDLLDQA